MKQWNHNAIACVCVWVCVCSCALYSMEWEKNKITHTHIHSNTNAAQDSFSKIENKTRKKTCSLQTKRTKRIIESRNWLCSGYICSIVNVAVRTLHATQANKRIRTEQWPSNAALTKPQSSWSHLCVDGSVRMCKFARTWHVCYQVPPHNCCALQNVRKETGVGDNKRITSSINVVYMPLQCSSGIHSPIWAAVERDHAMVISTMRIIELAEGIAKLCKTYFRVLNVNG